MAERLDLITNPHLDSDTLFELAASERLVVAALLNRDLPEEILGFIADRWQHADIMQAVAEHPNAPVQLKLGLDACTLPWPNLDRFFQQVNATPDQREAVLTKIIELRHQTLGEIWAQIAPDAPDASGTPMRHSPEGVEWVITKGDSLAEVIVRARSTQSAERVAAAVRAIAANDPHSLPGLAELSPAQVDTLSRAIVTAAPLPNFAHQPTE